jgi:hypothetical protein
VVTTGWTQHPFRADPWTDIADFLGGMTARHPHYSYMTAVIDSVITSNSTSLLAGYTSMHDLVVVPVRSRNRPTARSASGHLVRSMGRRRPEW